MGLNKEGQGCFKEVKIGFLVGSAHLMFDGLFQKRGH